MIILNIFLLKKIKKKEAEFKETVPYRLKIFEKYVQTVHTRSIYTVYTFDCVFYRLGNEPKKLKPPPGIGGDDPKLELAIRMFELMYYLFNGVSYSEVEVRKFFDTAHASNIVSDSHDLSSLHAHLPDPAHSNGERRKSSIVS